VRNPLEMDSNRKTVAGVTLILGLSEVWLKA
jgi:hypothetical protein